MNDKSTTILELKEQVNKFMNERDWHKFNSPKNTSMSITSGSK